MPLPSAELARIKAQLPARLSQAEAAAALHVSRSRLREIEDRALGRLVIRLVAALGADGRPDREDLRQVGMPW